MSAAPTDPPGWTRVTSEGLGYSMALPGRSYLDVSVAQSGSQGPYDKWMVMSPEGELAFGLLVGHPAEPAPAATYPPLGSVWSEIATADGVRVLVPKASGIDIFAGAIHDNYEWTLMAESGDLVGNDAKRSLLSQILSTLRFAGP